MIDGRIVLLAVVSQVTSVDIHLGSLFPTLLDEVSQPYTNITQDPYMVKSRESEVPMICLTKPTMLHETNYAICCHSPPLFPERLLEDCGARTLQTRRGNREIDPDDGELCDHFVCVFSKLDLLNMENATDVIKLYLYLDKWLEKYPKFTDTVTLIKDRCVDKDLPRSHPCPTKHLAGCITSTIIFECPAGLQILPQCKVIKEYLHHCGKYLMRSTYMNTNAHYSD